MANLIDRFRNILAGLTAPSKIGEALIIDFGGSYEINYVLAGEDYRAGLFDGVVFRLTAAGKWDAYAQRHIDGFGAEGVPFGGYGWANPQASAGQNASQGAMLADAVKFIGKVPPLKVWGDWETNYSNLGIKDYRLAVQKYIDTYEQAVGDVLGAYTNANSWDKWVANPTNGNTDIPNGRPLWVANWRGAPPPVIPYDWRKIGGQVLSSADVWAGYPTAVPLWQYVGGKWNVRWCQSLLDASTFNGSLGGYRAYFGIDGAPPPPPPDPAPTPEDGIQLRVISDTLRVHIAPSYSSACVEANLVRGDVVTVLAVEPEQDGVWIGHMTGTRNLGYSAAFYGGVQYMEAV